MVETAIGIFLVSSAGVFRFTGGVCATEYWEIIIIVQIHHRLNPTVSLRSVHQLTTTTANSRPPPIGRARSRDTRWPCFIDLLDLDVTSYCAAVAPFVGEKRCVAGMPQPYDLVLSSSSSTSGQWEIPLHDRNYMARRSLIGDWRFLWQLITDCTLCGMFGAIWSPPGRALYTKLNDINYHQTSTQYQSGQSNCSCKFPAATFLFPRST